MKIELLPLEFKSLDEEEPQYKHLLEDVELAGVPQSERIVKVLLELYNEALGVTDRAFYILFNDSKTYYARATLLSLITSEHASRSSIIKHVVEMLRNSSSHEKAYIAASLISESTPEYLFSTYKETEDLVSALVKYGKQLGVIRSTACRDFAFSEDELSLIHAMHRRFCTAVELLDGKCSFGLTEIDGEHVVCIRIGSHGFVLQRVIVSAVE